MSSGTKIICADAFKWLSQQPNKSIEAIVTGIPDLDEIQSLESRKTITKRDYIAFYERAVSLLLQKIETDGYVVLMQTDRKWDGEWIDKSHLSTSIAIKMGAKLMWHKIIHNREGTYLQRPTFSHLLCYSFDGTPGTPFPDVLSVGKHLYKNATSTNATCWVMDFLAKKKIRTVVDPFVGRGTIPYIASLFGMNAIGVDIDPEQCEYARSIYGNKSIERVVMSADYFANKTASE
jgi:hypothetical protein